MSQLVNRGVLMHRREILDNLVALSYTDCDYRMLHIVAVAFGVVDEFIQRTNTVLVIDKKCEVKK